MVSIEEVAVGAFVEFSLGGLQYRGKIAKKTGDYVVVDAEQINGSGSVRYPILVSRATILKGGK